MKLTEYIRETRGNATALAATLGVSLSQLSQMAAGTCPISPQRAVEIDRATGGKVRRWDCRPRDWHLIWPELIAAPGAPRIPRAVRAPGVPGVPRDRQMKAA